MNVLQLFFVCVAIWGSTWIAITFQLGDVAPEASVFYRFLLASLIVFAYCWARGLRLRHTAHEHRWMALFGVLMFSVQYIFVYYAEQNVVSGLVAVGYSAIPLLGMFGMRLFFATPITGRTAAGALLGIAGIVLVFLPEFARSHVGSRPVLGAAYTAMGVLAAACANLVAHRNHQEQLPLWQSLAWAMLYGALFSLAVIVLTGKALAFSLAPGYVIALLYLTVFGSIITFAAFLTLIDRIGPARAGYVGVMVPIVALVISAAFEGFRWHALTWVGVAVCVAGNIVILRERRQTAPIAPSRSAPT